MSNGTGSTSTRPARRQPENAAHSSRQLRPAPAAAGASHLPGHLHLPPPPGQPRRPGEGCRPGVTRPAQPVLAVSSQSSSTHGAKRIDASTVSRRGTARAGVLCGRLGAWCGRRWPAGAGCSARRVASRRAAASRQRKSWRVRIERDALASGWGNPFFPEPSHLQSDPRTTAWGETALLV